MFWLLVAFFLGVPTILAVIVQIRKRDRPGFYAEMKDGDVTEEAEITPPGPVI